MKEKIKTFFAICVLVLTVPYIVTLLFQGDKTSLESGKVQEILGEDSFEDLQAEGKDMNVEEYLAGVLAKEIPLDYHIETIKAQAVIARTALTVALESEDVNLPESMSREEMLELWGREGFEENYRVIEEAVTATKGEILIYKEEPIQAAFHAVSAGKTRNAKEALQKEEEPYLDSVESELDIPCSDYLKVVFLEKNEYIEKIKKACPELEAAEDNIMELVTVLKRDSSDYVTEIKIGEKVVTGEEFRGYLNLNSACFYLKEVEGKVRIVTKGLGHGLGLSQYGANELAKEGKDYKEILQYYYKDIEIKKN